MTEIHYYSNVDPVVFVLVKVAQSCLPRFFPVLAVADTGYCVGLQNYIDHSADRYRQLMQVLGVGCPRNINRLQNMCYCFFFSLCLGLRICGYNLSCGLRKMDL